MSISIWAIWSYGNNVISQILKKYCTVETNRFNIFQRSILKYLLFETIILKSYECMLHRKKYAPSEVISPHCEDIISIICGHMQSFYRPITHSDILLTHSTQTSNNQCMQLRFLALDKNPFSRTFLTAGIYCQGP